MKTATIPALQIDHELRQAAEDSLNDGETLGSFVEQSIREAVERRRHQREFIAPGLASRNDARASGLYVSADNVVAKLEAMLASAKAQK
jgi:predicted transcriptional regulator